MAAEMHRQTSLDRQAEIAVVLKGYPRLSETFIAQELLALERAGLKLRLWSLRHPTDTAVHPVHREIAAPVTYLPEYLRREPWRVLRGWWQARRRPGYRAARQAFLRDLGRDLTPNRLRRFGQACVLAAELPESTGWLYAHFLHTPGSVARYAALLRGLPWSVSAHARDIWTIPEWEKTEKLAEAAWTVTCTAVGAAHLASLTEEPDKVELLYHGLDFARFADPPVRSDTHDGTAPVGLLSVGRAVEKKGYEDLLAALALLPPDLDWHLTHIGGGALSKQLRARAAELGLSARISWLGAQPQERVLEAYRAADLFILASRIAEDGDRDGLPNVLMEAQSQALCCLSTSISAIPELIRDGETGLLVPPQDPGALADALDRLIRDPALRLRLGEAGYRRVRSDFAMAGGISQLLFRFGGGKTCRPDRGTAAAQ
ncbi:glycosyltransferase family 4 protein [Algihabitans albus]|uniref:glycosyltransferase family 4 protein n=1 Tax=Algihabitans albus TaxID=2164067 RepID=UPI001F3DA06E|nr:glycosyltransferase family 4 protein [Algihabitans albus]